MWMCTGIEKGCSCHFLTFKATNPWDRPRLRRRNEREWRDVYRRADPLRLVGDGQTSLLWVLRGPWRHILIPRAEYLCFWVFRIWKWSWLWQAHCQASRTASACFCLLRTDQYARSLISRTIKVRHARVDTKVCADLLECSSSIDSRFHSPGRKGTEGYRHCATYNLKTRT